MRLFVAILLSEPVKDMLMQTIRQLQPAVLDGRFSHRENLHLTLAFLGESSLKPAQQALHQLSGPSFAMTVEGVGRFRRDGGDILWAGVRKIPTSPRWPDRCSRPFPKRDFRWRKGRLPPTSPWAGRCCCQRGLISKPSPKCCPPARCRWSG